MNIRIGISGWTYPPWRGGAFYPKDLTQKRELEYASRQVRSIEINGTFYGLQRPKSFKTWYDATPEDFVFSVKGSRFITHMRRLKDVEVPLANFLASGVLGLREKLGPILWQLPPSFRYDKEVIESFLKLLPNTTTEAAKLAKKHHDARPGDQMDLAPGPARPLRHALEIRHESFATKEFILLLRKYKVALVVADTAGKWPFMEDVTSDFVYVRLHGDEELYASGYSAAALKKWAAKIKAWSKGKTPSRVKLHGPHAPDRVRGRDVFVYFDNDIKVHAPYDAMSLAKSLGVSAKTAVAPHKAGKVAGK